MGLRPVVRALALGLAVTMALALSATPGHAQQSATHVTERTVYEVASQLRCVVCQNLSVADSPSEMANQMRAIVRQQLTEGKNPQQIKDFFVSKYGEWVLLAPTT